MRHGLPSGYSGTVVILPILGWMGFHAWVIHKLGDFTWTVSCLDSLVFNLVLCSGIFLQKIMMRYLPKEGIFQASLGFSVILALLSQWVSGVLLIALTDGANYHVFLEQSASVRWAIGFLVYILSGIGFFYYSLWQDVKIDEGRKRDNAIMVRDAELQKLQLQLQPHFLFNSLNSINALIMINASGATDMVQRLSDFLRATLKRADEHWITLAEEMDYLSLYLSIEKVRFGHRLDVQIDCDEQIHLWLIPPLLIQPLVENAIKFGLYGTTDKVMINLKVVRTGESVQVEISNPFDADMQPTEGSGFGLSGLQRRLYLIYARNDLLKTTITNNYFTVQLTLPEKL